ncbi:MAG: NAD-dependent epimerase/dehydratase family protein [Deltaproteobacteria bacterium]|nr:NAD-dependent epimerase/dehydratase family protein [Deltaproteobacteria bacterium]
MSERNAFVTGAAGFIGSHLTDRLLEDGWNVTGIDSFEDYYPRALKERNLIGALNHRAFQLIEANLLDLLDASKRDRITGSLASADAVFHLAAQAGVRASWGTAFRTYTDNNVLATQALLEECLRTEVDRVVYASSSSVYGDIDVLPMCEDAICRPHSPYGVTKLAAEHLCRLYHRNFDLSTVSLRFFTVYGPRQRPDMAFHKFMRAMLEGRPIEIYGNGTQTRDFTFVSDIVDGIIAAALAPPKDVEGEVFNLGGGSRVSLSHAVDVLAKATDTTTAAERGDVQPGDVQNTSASLDKSRKILDYSPKVSLQDGLATEAEWMKTLIAS